VADKSSQLVLGALTRAAADALGVPLHGTKAAPGLFPATALGKQAAQRCCAEGYLAAVDPGPAPAGRAAAPRLTLTDKGRAYLLGQVSPRQVLEDFVRVLEAREAQAAGLLDAARQMQAHLEALRSAVGPVLAACRPAEAPPAPGGLNGLYQAFCHDRPAEPAGRITAHLQAWAASNPLEDCPLPELYRAAAPASIGAFHDALRRLASAALVHLHPWTGPLYAIPEPAYALLVGHEVAYYASLRTRSES
jgi:hypothetical protein